ncbi:MAG TPA: FKBP-type peptidyl-prolyl cis-trans isomerase [Saprospiraceae bacterium]|nr:FKBP-type peptidyl-prolyl cis-trans isomerase [Saprospiraceae bacterium]
MKLTAFVLGALVILSFTRCLEPSQYEQDDDIIQDYIKNKNLQMVKHETGLYYQIINSGSGETPELSDSVSVHYKGFLTNGQQFDGTTTSPATFLLGELITGWKIGIPLVKEGGEIMLLVPSNLGYGSISVGPIPANSVLVFEVELVDVK